jgi:hypothetical protein
MVKDVILNYCKNILIVGFFLVGLKYFVDYITRIFPFLLSTKIRIIVFMVGSAMLLVAAIGRLGWEIQTWDGNSTAERVDDILFWTFSVFGTALIIVDYFLGLQKNS